MVVTQEEEVKLVSALKFTSVVPGKVIGENLFQDLKPIDLAMKLHYIKALYFFPNNNNTLISMDELKTPMFEWLVSYFMTCGRIRFSSDPEPRPVIKLNDAGIRIVETRSSKTVKEWVEMKEFFCVQDQLIYGHALGPDLGFSPLVFIQLTWFSCGGFSVGLSWAHLLGDVFSASAFMNNLGHHLQGQKAQVLAFPDNPKPEYSLQGPPDEPLSIKRVNPVDDHWVAATKCKMVTHFFSISSTQLDQMVTRVLNGTTKGGEEKICKYFEVISSILWKIIAKVRKELEPKIVTICRPKSLKREKVVPYNGQQISTIKLDFSASKADMFELVSLISESMVDESDMVAKMIEDDKCKVDYIVYGANLTFVDMEEANVYGFKVKGESPLFVSYTVDGVWEEGSISVLSGAKDGKLIIVTLPEHELEEVKNEMKKEWCIV